MIRKKPINDVSIPSALCSQLTIRTNRCDDEQLQFYLYLMCQNITCDVSDRREMAQREVSPMLNHHAPEGT